MNNRIARFLLVLSLIVVILSACSVSSTSTTEVDSSEVDSSTETEQVEAAAEEVAEEATAETGDMGATYPNVDTTQELCYDNSEVIDCPVEGEAFYGQDAQLDGKAPNYTVSTTDDSDETVIDNVTGIIWTKSPDLEGIGNNDGEITSDDKLSSSAAATACDALRWTMLATPIGSSQISSSSSR